MSATIPAAPHTPTRTEVINTWGRVAVSIAVMVIFVVLSILVLTHEIAEGATAELVVGAVISMATGVVGYWIGSSAGSTAKDARAAAALTQQAPPPP